MCKRISTGIPRIILYTLLGVGVLLVGCEKKEGQIIPNQPPGIELTSGPIENSYESYAVEFFWAGWDEDGIVDHFLWAIDDTSSERAWNLTYLNRGTFPFPATVKGRPDSSQFSAFHTFYVKAVDNNDAESQVAFLSFNSTTVAPYTEIQRPEDALNPWGEAILVGSALYTEWTGYDPDGSNGEPVGYYFRLLPVDSELLIRPSLLLMAVADSSTIGSYPWEYIPGDSTAVNLTGLVSRGDTEPKVYVFCVRAVDEAGAIEPYYIFGRNVIVIQARPGQIGPNFTLGIEAICEYEIFGQWGKRVPPPRADIQRVEVPVGSRLRFYWSGEAEHYGGIVTGYRYGLDIENIDDPLQWSPWSLDRTSFETTFSEVDEGLHSFYVQCKDNGGGVSFGILDFWVVKFDFDKAVFFVDDYVNTHQYGDPQSTDPTDEQQDRFWRGLLTSAGLVEGADDGYMMFEGWNYAYPEKRESYVPLLEEISRYRALVWMTSTAWGTYTAFHKVVALDDFSNVLASYVTGGGRLWLMGQGTIRYSFEVPPTYPFDMNVNRVGNFMYDYCHIRGTRISAAQGDIGRRGLAVARSNEYPLPNLSLDILSGGRFEFAYNYFRGIGNIETCIEPMNALNVDTLFTYIAADSMSTRSAGMPCAFRWNDPNIDSEVIWFGFPLYWFEQEQAEEVTKLILREMLSPR